MAKGEKDKGAKPAGRVAKKGAPSAPALTDDGSEESKFQPRLRDMYQQQVVAALMKEFGYKM